MLTVIGSSRTGNKYGLAQGLTALAHPAYQRPGLGRPFRGVKPPGSLISRQEERQAPLVLVVQEIFGVQEHIKDVCRRLAKRGLFAISVDLYHRQGDVTR